MADVLKYDTAVLDMIAKDLDRLGTQISAYGSAVSRLASHMDKENGADLKISSSIYLKMEQLRLGSGSITACLNQYARALNRYQATAAKLGTNVRTASDMFATTERQLANLNINTGSASTFAGGAPSAGATVSRAPSNQAAKTDKEDEGYNWTSLLLKVISKAGPTGSIISALFDLTSGTPDKLLNYIVKAGDTSVQWVKGLFDPNVSAIDYAKNNLGLSKYIKNPSTATGWAAFGENFGNALKSGLTKPVSWITAGISSAYNNYVEFGGKITDRAVVEWATETAATVALGAGTAALVGAGLAAAGIAAPALAVGAASVILYAGVDALWANTLGNGSSIVESIGHTAGDLYEVCKDTTDFIYEGVKDLGANAGKWLGKKIGGLTKGIHISALWA